jgi:sugar O-acyltransferase (sialic acid O-acetyltransferase NeuD family)
MKDLYIFGVASFAEMAHYYFATEGDQKVVGFVVDDQMVEETRFCGKPIIPKSEFLQSLPASRASIFVAIGYSNRGRSRLAIIEQFAKRGYGFASFVSKNAYLASGNAGVSTNHVFILENNVVQAFSSVARDVVMWSGNHLGHHSILEQGVFISSHVAVASGTVIGARTFLGLGSVVFENLEIGEECLIGGGAVVNTSLAPRSTVIPGASSRVIQG